MRNYLFASLLVPVLLSTGNLYAQENNQVNLCFMPNGKEAKPDSADFIPGKNGFYLYRNCIYDLTLKNKLQLSAKITGIGKDSIYYTKYINSANAANFMERLDTLSLHPSQLKKLRLIGDRMMGIYSGISLKDFKYEFIQDTVAKGFSTKYKTVYAADSSHSTKYELVPYLTAQGIDIVYEQCGKTYYYRGEPSPVCEDTTRRPFVSKRGVWFSPSNANEVKGVNIGLASMNMNGDSLSIRGVNLNADVLSFFMGMYGIFYLPAGNTLINMPDTIDYSSINTNIRGISLSAGGVAGDARINGFSLNGGICAAVQTNGIIITGSQNLVQDFSGVNISLLRNRSIKGRGIQVGLLNICKDMKGIQIGLWNVNSKRKLPFINWNFGKRKEKR